MYVYMNPPSKKEIPKLSGELRRQMITSQIIKTYDRKVVDDAINECERCGSRHIQKRGRRKKIFCTVVLEEDGFKNVIIYTQAYWCVDCHQLNVSGKDLFYEGTAYGRPIVDQCLALAAYNPASRVERLMLESGIQIDRRTVLRYIAQFKEECSLEIKTLNMKTRKVSNIGCKLKSKIVKRGLTSYG